ncbi:MAG: putative baseplate assembly protein [Prochloraceae cyanobacterium]|nr:putative baseplate assembly protein [Prochloraceae cyanobacterium]
MNTQYRCQNERRRAEAKKARDLNGIDYLEIGSDRQTILVHFIHELPTEPLQKLKKQNLIISQANTLEELEIESVNSFANILIVRVERVGGFSTYTLRLVGNTSSLIPPPGFDPQLSRIDFSFRAEDASEFDCQPPKPLRSKQPPPPPIDYLAKDYNSFRTLMLDRLAVTIPQWRERNPADLGIMLVEILAYAADRLSYYQDAVATEAYLGTARQRISIRRHSRLLDYFMHEGCNARAWIVIELKEDFEKILRKNQNPTREGRDREEKGISFLEPSLEQNRPGVRFLTQTNLPSGVLSKDEEFQIALNSGAQVFEALHEFTLYKSLNEISFHTWGDEQCYLPKGSTKATLADKQGRLKKRLKEGSVLIFEVKKDSKTGKEKEPESKETHVVRLTKVTVSEDILFKTKVVEVEWFSEDALPFDLQISNRNSQGKLIEDISIARGNVVLVDAGRTRSEPERLWENLGWEQQLRPRLQEEPLTQQGRVYLSERGQWVLFDPQAPAKQAMVWKLRDVRPAIILVEKDSSDAKLESLPKWHPQQDLLNSDRFAREFIVETEDDGRAYLRFGDGVLGKQPQTTDLLEAIYRIGNGSQGNVGAKAIANIFILPENLKKASDLQAARDGIEKVRNPLPAEGGTDPEPIEQVRLYAPQAFREQRRAVTEQDYATVAQRYPGVQKALATRRWTGSWHTIFITVDRQGGLAVDEEFERGLLAFLEEFRLAGHDLEIEGPRFVSLNIAMTVTVKPDYFRASVKQALLETFSNQILADEQLGFFHPDRLSFGQSIYLSEIVSSAMEVAGVESVKVTRFQRLDAPSTTALETGQIEFERLEIARLDNNPNLPENGTIEFNLEGGL